MLVIDRRPGEAVLIETLCGNPLITVNTVIAGQNSVVIETALPAGWHGPDGPISLMRGQAFSLASALGSASITVLSIRIGGKRSVKLGIKASNQWRISRTKNLG